MITALFNVNGVFFLNSKKIMQSVKFQFYMVCINFLSELLSVQFDGTVFAFVGYSIALPV